MDIKIPKLSESVTSGTVVKIFVSEGDTVEKGQDLIELETEKATAAIPSPSTGTVTKILVKEGEAVKVGQIILSLSGGAPEKKPGPTKPKSGTGPLRGPVPKSVEGEKKVGPPMPSRLGAAAAPSLRKLARQFGVDLAKIPGSAPGGRVTPVDIRAYFEKVQAGGGAAARQPQALPDFSKWGKIKKEKLTWLRKKISEKMSESWNTVPHVTQFATAEISGLMVNLKKSSADYEKKGAKLTLTGVVLKALIPILKKYPVFNASMDEAAGEIVYKEYYHLGIAVDTEQGLIVPVIRDVDKKNLLQLSKELQELAEKTRQRKISLEELEGGTFTVSNQGGIGGEHFTPIIRTPEVAILGVGRASSKPVVRNQTIETGTILPLALSYDHRLIDGAQAARFITGLVKELEKAGVL